MRLPSFVLTITVLLLGALPLSAQSTCVCTADWLGTVGGRNSATAVNPAWSTCGCPEAAARASVPAEVRNTADLRRSFGRSYSLPTEEFTLWAARREEQRRDWSRQARAASLPRRPSDPLEAAAFELGVAGPEPTGSYRLRIEERTLVLRGEVPTTWDRRVAVARAEKASGLPVRDELRVTSLGQRSDRELVLEVERTLRDEGLTGRTVAVQAGIVEVRPGLPSEAEVVVLQIPGIREIR